MFLDENNSITRYIWKYLNLHRVCYFLNVIFFFSVVLNLSFIHLLRFGCVIILSFIWCMRFNCTITPPLSQWELVNIEIVTKTIEPSSWECLCQWINDLICTGDEPNLEMTLGNLITHEVNVQFNVLCAWVIERICS